MLTLEKAGVLVARATGVVLVLIGLASVISWLVLWFMSGPMTAGWTSYSPLDTTVAPTDELLLHDSYYVIADVATGVLPGALEAAAGLVIFLASRTVGRFLVAGLDDVEDTKRE